MNVILHGGDTRQFDQLKRREFITLPHGSAVWPLAARGWSVSSAAAEFGGESR
jgi:hypothetical protein